MHLRKQIRDAAASAVTGLASTGVRVFKGRNEPLGATEFPCLAVYARQDVPSYEEASMASSFRPLVPRVVELHVVGYAKALDGPSLEDTLDRMAEEVETALFAAFPFDGVALGMTLGQQTLDVDAEGDETLAVIDMVFNVMYRAAEGAPGTAV